MKLFWRPQTRSVRVVWMLEELAVPYERVLIDVRDPAMPRDPEFARASPMRKAPALADGDARLADSAAICLYLADRYPTAGLAPAVDHVERGAYLWWMFFTPAVIEPAMSENFAKAKPDRFRNGWGDFDLMIETFERGLETGPWILGAGFSAADVMVGSSAVFMKQFGMLPANPAIEAYADRCLARPAYRRALAIDAGGA
jgi:glutathione S-transferase